MKKCGYHFIFPQNGFDSRWRVPVSHFHPMAKIILGSDTLQIEDFSSIVKGDSIVVLDTAALSNVRRMANNVKGSKAPLVPLPSFSALSPPTTAKIESNDQVRAVILAKLAAIMQGRSGIRAEVAEYLAELLNKGFSYSFSRSESVAGITNELLSGSGAPAGLDSPPPGPGTAVEAATISELLASPGLLAYAVTQLRGLVPILDGAAALSCEAISTFDTPFSDLHADKSRAHNGIVACAERIRSLLSVSKNLTVPKASEVYDTASFRTIPQVHGPLYDLTNHARLVARVEINSAPYGPCDGSSLSAGAFDATAVLTTASSLLNYLAPIAINISKRLEYFLSCPRSTEANENTKSLVKLAQECVTSVLTNVKEASLYLVASNPDSGIVVASLLCNSIQQVQLLAAIEASAASGILTRRNDVLVAEALEAEKLKAAKAAEMAEKFGGGGEGKKKKEKEKKPKSKGLVLGVGTRPFLDWITTRLGGTTLNIDSISSAQRLAIEFDPCNTDLETGAFPFIIDLVKKITSGGIKRKPTVPKGARDFLPEQMQVRAQAFDIIRSVFSCHGAVEIDTPVFELRSTLMDKYGEDQKLIYELADQGGEQLALRYDLTVPFARFLATNPIGNIKRFHISKVYRRDQPQMKKGRFREFYQCDYDVAGTYGRMIPDAEVLCVGAEILSKLPLGGFKIKLNHRELLDAMLEICGVVPAKFRVICSAIDKLDKMPWADVKTEMVEVKGLAPEVADKIGRFVQLSGDSWSLYHKLVSEADQWFGRHEIANKALEDLRLLFTYLEAMGQLDKIQFDLSLARGLDYYTGVIYEAVLTSPNQVGSIAAGGRYDRLVGMFSEGEVPCVGISIGVERVFAILEDTLKEKELLKVKPVNVSLISADKGADMLKKRMEYASVLWANGISASFVYGDNLTLKKQLDSANVEGIRWVVIFGSTELATKTLNIKDLVLHTQITVPEESLVAELIALGVEQNVRDPLIPETLPTSTLEEVKASEGKTEG